MTTDYPELEKQVAVFRENQEMLARRHHGQYVVVHGGEIHGPFGSLVEAVIFAREEGEFKRGTYSIHRCMYEAEEPPIILHSRVHVG